MTEEMTMTQEEITPAKALEYLGSNRNNRHLNNRVVTLYADQMREGKWDETASPIVFFKSGRLADGQHRLNAVIKANIPVKMFVCRNAPYSGNYDNGIKRNTRDQILLGNSIKYSTMNVSVANLALRVKNGQNSRPTAQQVSQWLENNDVELLTKLANLSNTNIPGEVKLRQSAYIYAAYSYYKSNPTNETLTEVKDVIKIIKNGFMNDRTSGSKAAIKFRNAAMNKFGSYNAISTGSEGQFFKVKLLQKVLALYHMDSAGGRKAILDCPEEFLYVC